MVTFVFQFRDIRNIIMHSGQNSVTDNELISHIDNIQQMVQLTVPTPLLLDEEHKLIFEKIVKVCMTVKVCMILLN